MGISVEHTVLDLSACTPLQVIHHLEAKVMTEWTPEMVVHDQQVSNFPICWRITSR